MTIARENDQMINYSNPIMIRFRAFCRSIGFLRPAVLLYRRWVSAGYEDRFDSYMMQKIKPDEIIWDVGANVGHFTERFSVAVGHSGKVIAFEPSPTAQGVLNARVQGAALSNVVVEPKALGGRNEIVTFWHSCDVEGSVTDGMDYKKGAVSTDVEVITGDSYLASNPELPPNCIKIDVEGFESDVLRGMEALLRTPKLRAVFVEVHFEHSARRGLVDAPNLVVSLLEQAGFFVKWVDPSHIAAER